MNENHFFQNFITFTASVHQLKHALTSDLRPKNLTPIQYSILEYISVNQPVIPSDISECQQISMPNISRELKKLTEKDLITKHADEKDRRKQYIVLSKEGKAIMDSVFYEIDYKLKERLHILEEEELLEINNAMDLLQKKLFFSK
ncbi:MarR family winged helix-turn-helix transcriptional regulator [Niallia sp. JL1B1071]|uniref:MarR family winged helix-turn-helix transcriptional regulator n=1 Tax=Niallia tiangongensis TaxID=3237105 RepID=UPI0037DD12EE